MALLQFGHVAFDTDLIVLDKDGTNDASQRYRRLMEGVMAEVHRAFDAGEDFDITVDSGRPIEGYRRVVRVGDGTD